MFEETNLDLCLCLCTSLFILKYFIFKSSFPYTQHSTNLLKSFIKYFFIRKNEQLKNILTTILKLTHILQQMIFHSYFQELSLLQVTSNYESINLPISIC